MRADDLRDPARPRPAGQVPRALPGTPLSLPSPLDHGRPDAPRGPWRQGRGALPVALRGRGRPDQGVLPRAARAPSGPSRPRPARPERYDRPQARPGPRPRPRLDRSVRRHRAVDPLRDVGLQRALRALLLPDQRRQERADARGDGPLRGDPAADPASPDLGRRAVSPARPAGVDPDLLRALRVLLVLDSHQRLLARRDRAGDREDLRLLARPLTRRDGLDRRLPGVSRPCARRAGALRAGARDPRSLDRPLAPDAEPDGRRDHGLHARQPERGRGLLRVHLCEIPPEPSLARVRARRGLRSRGQREPRRRPLPSPVEVDRPPLSSGRSPGRLEGRADPGAARDQPAPLRVHRPPGQGRGLRGVLPRRRKGVRSDRRGRHPRLRVDRRRARQRPRHPATTGRRSARAKRRGRSSNPSTPASASARTSATRAR